MVRRSSGPQTAEQTRQRLLAATEALVVREGVVALSVRRIANEAGVNSALIGYHFGDTSGLLRELARLNAGQIRDARAGLLDVLESRAEPDFEGSVEALVLPLWAPAAMSPQERAIVVLDEIFSRARPPLHDEIWAEFAGGVRRVSAALGRAIGCTDGAALAWRIRFVTAAALDIPPRSGRSGDLPRSAVYGPESGAERLAQFLRFARQALRAV
jgi:AcrR family transcriptional regulator